MEKIDASANGRQLILYENDLLGVGGEGKVFRNGGNAVKIYHTAVDSQKKEKLLTFINTSWLFQDPSRIAFPLELVEKNSQTIGFTMPLLGNSLQEISSLSNKRYRSLNGIDSSKVTEIFLDCGSVLKEIHGNNLIIGDFNDRNIFIGGNENKQTYFLDFDAWQYGKYPCPVATERFVVPELYGKNLSLYPLFKEEYDWYSFALLYFKSLLLTHPYGGKHPIVSSFVERTQKRLTVLDKEVIYPKIAADPKILSPDLKDLFFAYFKKGSYMDFPLEIMADYLKDLNGKTFNIPNLQSISLKAVESKEGVIVKNILSVDGTILSYRIIEDGTLVVISKNSNSLHYYEYKDENLFDQEIQLPEDFAFAKVDIVNSGDCLVFLKNDTKTIEVFKRNENSPLLEYLKTLPTDIFALNRKAMFKTDGQSIFRIISNTLVRTDIDARTGFLTNKVLRNVNTNQTWFTVGDRKGGKTPVLGFFQVMDNQYFWLIFNEKITMLEISNNKEKEILRDISVRFDKKTVLLFRIVEREKDFYKYTDIFDENGENVLNRIEKMDSDSLNNHGFAYSNLLTFHSSDEGIKTLNHKEGRIKVFEKTQNYLDENSRVELWERGLLVVNDSNILYLEIKK